VIETLLMATTKRFFLQDKTGTWGAGLHGKNGDDCIGLVVQSWSTTQITFTFGSYYSVNGYQLAATDQYSLHIEGTVHRGKVRYS